MYAYGRDMEIKVQMKKLISLFYFYNHVFMNTSPQALFLESSLSFTKEIHFQADTSLSGILASLCT